MRIAAIVEYLGTNYAGFQIQPNQNTIQLCIQNALSKIANHDVKIEASGRTDAGVHALGQVFHFDTESQRPLSSWRKGANSFLPYDISIKWVSEVDENFHARYNVKEREYQYLLHHNETPSAIWYQKAGHYGYEINFKLLDKVLREFIGKHDFSSFRSSECQSKKPERIMYGASYQKKENFILFKFTADGFLHHQIRNMMSVILDIVSGKKPLDYVQYLFEVKDRTKASNTFSPNGLYLTNIKYEKKFKIVDLKNTIII